MLTDLLLKIGELKGRVTTRREIYGNSQGGWDDMEQCVDQIIVEIKAEIDKQRGGTGQL